MRELWGSPERFNARKTYADVASRLGVDEETVRNRLRRLKESGFLLGWRVVPHPRLLGCESSMLLLEFDDQEEKETAIPKLKRADGVVVLASIYGKGLLVTYYDDERHRSSKRIAATEGLSGSQSLGGMSLPPTDFRMTPTDWQIVGSMLRNAEAEVSQVARMVKVSPRTVKRRLNSMMDSAAISVMPMVDQRRSGGVSYTLMVEADGGKAAEVAERIAPRIEKLVFRATYPENGLIFGFWTTNVAEGTDVLRWARGQEGVKSARGHVVDEVVYSFDWLEREAARLSGATARPRTPAP